MLELKLYAAASRQSSVPGTFDAYRYLHGVNRGKMLLTTWLEPCVVMTLSSSTLNEPLHMLARGGARRFANTAMQFNAQNGLSALLWSDVLQGS